MSQEQIFLPPLFPQSKSVDKGNSKRTFRKRTFPHWILQKRKANEITTQHYPNDNINESQSFEFTTNNKQSTNSIAELSTFTLIIPKYTKQNLRKKDTNN